MLCVFLWILLNWYSALPDMLWILVSFPSLNGENTMNPAERVEPPNTIAWSAVLSPHQKHLEAISLIYSAFYGFQMFLSSCSLLQMTAVWRQSLFFRINLHISRFPTSSHNLLLDARDIAVEMKILQEENSGAQARILASDLVFLL